MNARADLWLADAPVASQANPGRVFVRGCIEGNYFYFLSATLMMLGCYLLMHSANFEASVFLRSLVPLLILEGYQAVVIAAAALIVWKLSRLDDAFNLLIIALALMLDPTFFANAFLTMLTLSGHETQVWGTNMICLSLVPMKLMLLARVLHFDLHPRLLAGFTVAAGCVYLGPARLNLDSGKGIEVEILYTLSWTPLVLAMILPEMRRGLAFARRAGEFATDRQLRWLGRLSQALPLAILFSHIIENSQVYGLRFYWLYGAPMLLAFAVLFIRNLPEEPIHARIVMLDAMAIVALLLTIPMTGAAGKEAVHSIRETTPAFIAGSSPLICTLAVIAALYVYVAFAHMHMPALVRVAVMAAAGILWLVIQAINLSDVATSVAVRADAAVLWVWNHLLYFGMAAQAGLVWLAYRFPGKFTWRIMAWNLALVSTGIIPGGLSHWWPEWLQVLLVIEIGLCHKFGDETRNRHGWAFILMLIAAIRFYQAAETPQIILAVSEALLLAALGFIYAEGMYLLIGFMLAAAISAGGAWRVMGVIPPAYTVIAAGTGMFAIALVVTFTKERLLSSALIGPVRPDPRDLGWPPPPPVVRSEHPIEKKEDEPMQYQLVIERPGAEDTEPTVELETMTRFAAGDAVTDEPVPAVAPAEPPVEIREVPNPEGIIRQLFMDDPSRGIYRVPQEVEEILRRERLDLTLRNGECLLTEFFDPDNEHPVLFLTNMRVILMESEEPGRTALGSIDYAQIARIGRSLESVHIVGHTGQIMSVTGLSVYQASALKKGLEILLAELAG